MTISLGYPVTQVIFLLNERLFSIYLVPSTGWQGTQSNGAFDGDQSKTRSGDQEAPRSVTAARCVT